MTSLTKRQRPKTKKKIFIADSKTCRVFWGFNQLSSAIGWGTMRLVGQLKYHWFCPDFQVRYIRRLAANVLK